MRAHTPALLALLTLAAVALVPVASAAVAPPGDCTGVTVHNTFSGVCGNGCSGPNGPGAAVWVNGSMGCIYPTAASMVALQTCYGAVVKNDFTGVCLQGCSGPNGPGTAIYVRGAYSGCIY